MDDLKSQRLRAIIKPVTEPTYEVTMLWNSMEKTFDDWVRDWGGCDLNPDFQRGHVWTTEQQQHYIENCMRKLVSTAARTIQFNCPQWNTLRSDKETSSELPLGMQCIDGLQRITAVQGFFAGRVRPFGMPFEEFEGTEFSPRRMLAKFNVAIYDFQTRADLLQHYLDFNAGGTPHSPSEIERVRQLMDEATPSTAAPSM